MERTKKIALICALALLGVAFLSDHLAMRDYLGNHIKKGDVGADETQLEVYVENMESGEKIPYTIDIVEKTLSEQEAQELFEKAKEEIEKGLYYPNESAEAVYTGIHMKSRYVKGKVKASFEMTPSDVLAEDGSVLEDILSENGELLTVNVLLKVQKYECEYQFPIQILEKRKDNQEYFLHEIKKGITETDDEIILPEKVEGAELKWTKEPSRNFSKILGLELIAILIVVIIARRKKEEERVLRKKQMEYEYPLIVSKFAILLGAGMSVKQVWYNISASYLEKRQKGAEKKSPIYEEMLETYYELLDGETEVNAYRNFGNRVQSATFQRLIRLLNQNNRRGSHGISKLLELESQRAFSERIHLARELGEKAQTRLLAPLLLMMMVIFVIVMAPAVLQFRG